jgi:hypothetical protein
MCSPKYTCQGCGRQSAGGGQRFCWSCLVDVFFGQPTGTTARQERAKCRTPRSGVEEAHLEERKGGASVIEIRDRSDKVIHRSRNLRGIFDHARRTWVEEAVAMPTWKSTGLLHVTFGDGSTCRTEFASYGVLCQWLRSRRSWAGVRRIAESDSF